MQKYVDFIIPAIILVLLISVYFTFIFRRHIRYEVFPSTLAQTVGVISSNMSAYLLIVVSVGLALPLLSDIEPPSPIYFVFFDILFALAMLVSKVPLLYFLSKRSTNTFTKIIGTRWIGIETCLWLIALAIAGRVLYEQILYTIGLSVPADIAKQPEWTTTLIRAITSMIFAPILEEVFYRGFCLNGLRKRYGTLFAVLITSTLFSIAHVPGDLVSVLLLGLGTALVYINTGSIYAPIAVHFGYNLFAQFNRTPWIIYLEQETNGALTYNTWTLTIAANICIFAYLLRNRWLRVRPLTDADNFVL